ncbi:MAG: hypothetical protein NTX49_10180 [Chlamydiae bacterium]|nr:hypothetical protein [Chlamydiota bacterium]
MSGVAQLANTGALATPTLRSPSLLRARPSVAGVADRAAEASERALADLTAMVARLQSENVALRGEVTARDSRLEEAAAASEGAMQAQSGTNTLLSEELAIAKSTITALSEKLAESESMNAKNSAVINEIKGIFAGGNGPGGSKVLAIYYAIYGRSS